MKIKELKKYLNKTITYKTIWDTYHTAKLIDIVDYFAIFKDGDTEITIKVFNIVEVQLYKNI